MNQKNNKNVAPVKKSAPVNAKRPIAAAAPRPQARPMAAPVKKAAPAVPVKKPQPVTPSHPHPKGSIATAPKKPVMAAPVKKPAPVAPAKKVIAPVRKPIGVAAVLIAVATKLGLATKSVTADTLKQSVLLKLNKMPDAAYTKFFGGLTDDEYEFCKLLIENAPATAPVAKGNGDKGAKAPTAAATKAKAQSKAVAAQASDGQPVDWAANRADKVKRWKKHYAEHGVPYGGMSGKGFNVLKRFNFDVNKALPSFEAIINKAGADIKNARNRLVGVKRDCRDMGILPKA